MCYREPHRHLTTTLGVACRGSYVWPTFSGTDSCCGQSPPRRARSPFASASASLAMHLDRCSTGSANQVTRPSGWCSLPAAGLRRTRSRPRMHRLRSKMSSPHHGSPFAVERQPRGRGRSARLESMRHDTSFAWPGESSRSCWVTSNWSGSCGPRMQRLEPNTQRGRCSTGCARPPSTPANVRAQRPESRGAQLRWRPLPSTSRSRTLVA
jgi:hypothetical protein